METVKKPVIYKLTDDAEGLKEFQDNLKGASKKEQDIILQYPTVYIHNWQDNVDYEVYIGESSNVVQRTKQHYSEQSDEGSWRSQLTTHEASLYIIGHEHFNKSLTMDIENRLMQYLMGSERVKKIHNIRQNPQNKYYPDFEFDDIFRMVWSKLHKCNRELFPLESELKNSAIFKASPFHKMTNDQKQIKEIVVQRVSDALKTGNKNQIIFIEGDTGTGKTVLNSSIFYEIFARAEEEERKIPSCYMLVNHEEQFNVYLQIAQKLRLTDRYGEVVYKPTSFINRHTTDDSVDVVFVDEAHLLWTQGKMGYRGKNQLQDIVDRARVTVVMFDENQILTTEQYWEAKILEKFREQARSADNYFELKEQLRMKASKDAVKWIDDFTKERKIEKIPENLGGYEIRIFDKPEELEAAIKEKAFDDQHRLSRLVATYDWKYDKKGENTTEKYWEVVIGDWRRPWNKELKKDLSREEKREIKSSAWAEQPQTINEVGSTFTIQGADLNFAGVILGPSVKYRDGKVIFDPAEKKYKKMTQNRTLSDGTKRRFGETLTQHEVRVLMTRGVEGLYIYACDRELREALLKASKIVN